jgi:hypothetical protein
MIYWAQLLHFYQPPNQVPSVLKRICDESYRPLLRESLKSIPMLGQPSTSTVSLTDMLIDCGHGDVIDGLRILAENGQIEFTGTGKYHPILPLDTQRRSKEADRTEHGDQSPVFSTSHTHLKDSFPQRCATAKISCSLLSSQGIAGLS